MKTIKDTTRHVAVILAGGAARRMGADVEDGLKTLLPLAGQSLLEHVVARLQSADCPPEQIVLNLVTEQIGRIASDLPVALDDGDSRRGPLAGIAAGLEWRARYAPEIDWVLTVTGDAPFLPCDLALRLFEAAQSHDARIVCAASCGRTHPPIALWHCTIHESLKEALSGGIRKIDVFSADFAPIAVSWDGAQDPFFNINSSEELYDARCAHHISSDVLLHKGHRSS